MYLPPGDKHFATLTRTSHSEIWGFEVDFNTHVIEKILHGSILQKYNRSLEEGSERICVGDILVTLNNVTVDKSEDWMDEFESRSCKTMRMVVLRPDLDPLDGQGFTFRIVVDRSDPIPWGTHFHKNILVKMDKNGLFKKSTQTMDPIVQLKDRLVAINGFDIEETDDVEEIFEGTFGSVVMEWRRADRFVEDVQKDTEQTRQDRLVVAGTERSRFGADFTLDERMASMGQYVVQTTSPTCRFRPGSIIVSIDGMKHWTPMKRSLEESDAVEVRVREVQRMPPPRPPLLDSDRDGLIIHWVVPPGVTHSIVVVQEIVEKGGKHNSYIIDGRTDEAKDMDVPCLGVLAPLARITVELIRTRTYCAYVSVRDKDGQWTPFSKASAAEKLDAYNRLEVVRVQWTRKQHKARTQTYYLTHNTSQAKIYEKCDYKCVGPNYPELQGFSRVHGYEAETPGWLQIGPNAFVPAKSFRKETLQDRVKVIVPAKFQPGCIPVDFPLAGEQLYPPCPGPMRESLLADYKKKCAIKMMAGRAVELREKNVKAEQRATMEKMEWLTNKVESIKRGAFSSDTHVFTENRHTGRTWKVNVIQTSESLPLGAVWDPRHSKLNQKVIRSIKIGSLLDRWNEEQLKLETHLHVKKGDELIEINGRPGHILFMENELRKPYIVLTFFRPLGKASKAMSLGELVAGNLIELNLSTKGHALGIQVDWNIVPPRILAVNHSSEAAACGVEPNDGIVKIHGYEVKANNIKELLHRLEFRPLTLMIEKACHRERKHTGIYARVPESKTKEEIFEITVPPEEEAVGMRLDFGVTPPIVLYTLKDAFAEKANVLRGDRLLALNGAYVMTMEESTIEATFQQRPLTIKMMMGTSLEREMYQEQRELEQRAALMIQTRARMMIARRHFLERLHGKAVIKLQNIWRRKRAKTKVQEQKKMLNDKSETIQKKWREKRRRYAQEQERKLAHVRDKEQKNKSATRIQTYWRGKQDRAIVAIKRAEIEEERRIQLVLMDKEARKIQALARGRAVRNGAKTRPFLFRAHMGRSSPHIPWGIEFETSKTKSESGATVARPALEDENTTQSIRVVLRVHPHSPASAWNELQEKDPKRRIMIGDALIVDESGWVILDEEIGSGRSSGDRKKLSCAALFQRSTTSNRRRITQQTRGSTIEEGGVHPSLGSALYPSASSSIGVQKLHISKLLTEHCFTAVLTRLHEREPWGFELKEDGAPYVQCITPHSPAARWNKDQARVRSGCNLRIGSLVMAINGGSPFECTHLSALPGFQLTLHILMRPQVYVEGELDVEMIVERTSSDQPWGILLNQDARVVSVSEESPIKRCWEQWSREAGYEDFDLRDFYILSLNGRAAFRRSFYTIKNDTRDNTIKDDDDKGNDDNDDKGNDDDKDDILVLDDPRCMELTMRICKPYDDPEKMNEILLEDADFAGASTYEVTVVRIRKDEGVGIGIEADTGVVSSIREMSPIDVWNNENEQQGIDTRIRLGDEILALNDIPLGDSPEFSSQWHLDVVRMKVKQYLPRETYLKHMVSSMSEKDIEMSRNSDDDDIVGMRDYLCKRKNRGEGAIIKRVSLGMRRTDVSQRWGLRLDANWEVTLTDPDSPARLGGVRAKDIISTVNQYPIVSAAGHEELNSALYAILEVERSIDAAGASPDTLSEMSVSHVSEFCHLSEKEELPRQVGWESQSRKSASAGAGASSLMGGEEEEPERPKEDGYMYFVDLEDNPSIYDEREDEEEGEKNEHEDATKGLGLVLKYGVVQFIRYGSILFKWNKRRRERRERVQARDRLLAVDGLEWGLLKRHKQALALIEQGHMFTFFRPYRKEEEQYQQKQAQLSLRQKSFKGGDWILPARLTRQSISTPWGFIWDADILAQTQVRVIQDVALNSIVARYNDGAEDPLKRGDVLVSVNGDATCENIAHTRDATMTFLRHEPIDHGKGLERKKDDEEYVADDKENRDDDGGDEN